MSYLPRKVALFILALVTVVSTPIGIIYAADDQNCDDQIDYEFYRTNRIIWDDECKTASNCYGSSSGGITGGVKAGSLDDLEKSATLERIFQDLLNGGMNAVQAAAVMGNLYVESGRTFAPDTYEGGVDRPQSGYGIVQWTNVGPSYTQGRRTNLENYARQQGKPKSDLDLQISFLFKEYNESYKGRMAGGGFGKGTNVTDATINWMQVFENPLQEGSDPAQTYSLRIPAASKIYAFYSDLTADPTAAPTSPVTTDNATAATCNGQGGSGTSASAVAGNIVQTALNYAQPEPVDEGVNQKSDAKASYQTDKPKFAPDGLWSDCGAFVATVMKASGVDTNFPILHVALQAQYVRDNPDKYQIINNASASDVQPGDLLIENNTDHIEIAKGGTAAIDASNGFRVPSVRPTGVLWIEGRGFFIARYIGEN